MAEAREEGEYYEVGGGPKKGQDGHGLRRQSKDLFYLSEVGAIPPPPNPQPCSRRRDCSAGAQSREISEGTEAEVTAHQLSCTARDPRRCTCIRSTYPWALAIHPRPHMPTYGHIHPHTTTYTHTCPHMPSYCHEEDTYFSFLLIPRVYSRCVFLILTLHMGVMQCSVQLTHSYMGVFCDCM